MIFVTVGTQKFQFNRLLQKIDELIESGVIKEEVYAQTGYCTYKPKNYRYKDFMGKDEMLENQLRASFLIVHGGTGAIIEGIKLSKPVIAVPRLKEFHEHVDDHQVEIVEEFTNDGIISGSRNIDDLGNLVTEIMNKRFVTYISNKDGFISYLSELIESF